MLRGAVASVLLGLALGAMARGGSAGSPGPQFWVARRGEARVFILGFGEARDTSWLTPSIQHAFEASSQLWLENPGSDEPDSRDASAKRAAAERMEKLGHESGRTLFDALEPPVRKRIVDFMAAMSDKAQNQYIEWLLDFLDDYKKGLNDDDETFGWIEGRKLAVRSLDRMRTKMPDLYQVMQPQRNLWWARKIEELLATKGPYFVAVGQLHVMGPDGIPRQLERLGVEVEPLP